MTRLEALKPEEMDEDQLEYHQAVLARPIFKDFPEDSPLEGPFNAWVRSPKFAKVFSPFARYVRDEGVLEERLVELAIITVGRVWSSEFEFGAHAPKALEAGVDPEIVEAIRNRQPPQFDRTDEKAVFHFANELTADYTISSRTYQAAVDELGEQGVVELIGLMGCYVTVCMTLNAFEVPLIPSMEKPFPDK
ncbi:MAG: carboxymuconolactone decarboxylase family protein [Proteobacteria bacterium]|nr:carboxymuconolactone decarboxylase family protein [Pseudomonadota bacterium]